MSISYNICCSVSSSESTAESAELATSESTATEWVAGHGEVLGHSLAGAHFVLLIRAVPNSSKSTEASEAALFHVLNFKSIFVFKFKLVFKLTVDFNFATGLEFVIDLEVVVYLNFLIVLNLFHSNLELSCDFNLSIAF